MKTIKYVNSFIFNEFKVLNDVTDKQREHSFIYVNFILNVIHSFRLQMFELW